MTGQLEMTGMHRPCDCSGDHSPVERYSISHRGVTMESFPAMECLDCDGSGWKGCLECGETDCLVDHDREDQ